MSKLVKELELNTLRQRFDGVRNFVVLRPFGVDADTDYTVRKSMREKGVKLQVVKNSLAKRALSEQGIDLNDEIWEGPTLLAWGTQNHKELAKAIEGMLKDVHKDIKRKEDHKYTVKTAVADGQGLTLDQAKVLPTREDAIAELLGTILGPGAELAAALTGPGSELVAALGGPGAELASQVAQIGRE